MKIVLNIIVFFAFNLLLLAVPDNWEVRTNGGQEVLGPNGVYCGYRTVSENATGKVLTCTGEGILACETMSSNNKLLHNKLIHEATKKIVIDSQSQGSFNHNMVIDGVLKYGTISWNTDSYGESTLNSTVNE